MNSSRWEPLLAWIEKWAAGLLAFTLPFTSAPFVARLTGSSMVAPLSLLPLGVLVLAWYVPFLLRGGRLPRHSTPLLAFAGVALLASLLAFFLNIPTYRSVSIVRSELEGLATLAIGILFYLVISSWAAPNRRLPFFLRWVNWGGLLMIAWCLLQAAVWFRLRVYPDWFWAAQGWVATGGTLFVQRVNGFAYEPSWLAHQLNMLYLPYWLAATVSGYSAHGWRLGPLRFENLLLAAGAGMMVLSVSRVGLLAFLLMVAYLVLWASLRLVGWLQRRLLRRYASSDRRTRTLRVWFTIASIVVMLGIYGGMAAGAAYGLSRYDQRMARLFDLSTLREQSFLHYANQLVFAERIVFWQAGWEVFNDYPLLGVGVGNAGFYFPQTLSPFSYSLTEVRHLLYRWTSLPNIKSLWVRILAETGVVGLACFLSWCYVLWQSARYLTHRPGRLSLAMGLVGSFVLVGLLIEGFSIDTFALPYYWVSLGMATAACEVARADDRLHFEGGEDRL